MDRPGICIRKGSSSCGKIHRSHRRHTAHGIAHCFVPGMYIEVGGGCHIRMAQQSGHGRHINAVFNGAGGKCMAHSMEFHMFQMQFRLNSGKIMTQIVRVHHTPATIENNEIVVKEKAIYWGIPSEQEMITFDVYSDVNKKNKIDSKEYTEDNIANEIVTVEDYLDEASTITTKFAYDQDTNSYYFKSSVIE